MTSDDSSTRSFIERQGGRVIVIDAATSDVLLLRGVDPADRERGDFWITPGGGIDEGEDVHEATVRELWEEVGLRVDATELGPVVLHRVGEFPFGGELVRQTESYFALVTERFKPRTQLTTPFEAEVVQGVRWRSLLEIDSSAEPVYPTCLVELVSELLAKGPLEEPWTEEQRLV